MQSHGDWGALWCCSWSQRCDFMASRSSPASKHSSFMGDISHDMEVWDSVLALRVVQAQAAPTGSLKSCSMWKTTGRRNCTLDPRCKVRQRQRATDLQRHCSQPWMFYAHEEHSSRVSPNPPALYHIATAWPALHAGRYGAGSQSLCTQPQPVFLSLLIALTPRFFQCYPQFPKILSDKALHDHRAGKTAQILNNVYPSRVTPSSLRSLQANLIYKWDWCHEQLP